jgi:5-methylcytosine-specific restriction endonuclease McrA
MNSIIQFCPRGHDTWKHGRLPSNHGCRVCHRERRVKQHKQAAISAAGKKGPLIYTGRDQFCPNGHDTWQTGRYLRNRGCRLCHLSRSVTQRKLHPEQLRAYREKWARENIDLVRRLALEWRKKNRLYDSLRGSLRRAVYRVADIDPSSFDDLISYYGSQCVYCGDMMTGFDHLHPLSRGGEHTIENLAPACRSCNSAKKDRSIWFMLTKEFRVRPSAWLVPGR